MCLVLQIARSVYYYEARKRKNETALEEEIKEIFHRNRRVYGTRKLKKELAKAGKVVSRRKIGRIMKKHGLVSKYTIAQFKVHKDECNEAITKNIVDRQFDERDYRDVVVSDLTYVRVGSHWNYICVLLDLFNREIIGYSAGPRKDAELVKAAFVSVKGNLQAISIFHTDRGKEFDNKLINDVLDGYGIDRSLSKKGCPYDNAVAEATYKIIKTEVINNETFAGVLSWEGGYDIH